MIQLYSKRDVRKLKIYKLMQGNNLYTIKRVRGKEENKEGGNEEIVSEAMRAIGSNMLPGCGL